MILSIKLKMMLKRIPNKDNWPVEHIDRIIHGESLEVLKNIPDNCVSLVVTSPPYWDFIDYEVDGQYGHTDYETYLNQLTPIWQQIARVLIPNDIDIDIVKNVEGMERLSYFIWEKPIGTIENMFGSYPYPPNLYEKNAIECINVYVKQGPPEQLPKEIKEYSKLTKANSY